MAADDDIMVFPIGAVHPRLGGPRGVKSVGHYTGHSPQRHSWEDSADISLSDGRQAAELLYSATMDQIGQLTGLETSSLPLHESSMPGLSHSQHLLTGVEALAERYCHRHPELDRDSALSAFAPLARAGLERGYAETCEVLKQLNALSDAGAAQLQGLYLLCARLLTERWPQA
ncbi:DUF5610 domain-containing protein [Chromobacterium sp. IIBBL 290-4]|uniref:DUF5610 domain-containing protein n=1 Tax=Chromobacterium sp. IIBBL 290-4 TaxID=2953890 RepID=UPI0020B689B7|nr:DUF5610 domain-containing protein [Chromobacterium sp. IIBBL 290-4]UTH73126.1 DUF5610 domain-containing protein [Chromobacterium sp. IIBBL 290-4]